MSLILSTTLPIPLGNPLLPNPALPRNIPKRLPLIQPRNLNLNLDPAPPQPPMSAILDKPAHPPLSQPFILPQQPDVLHPAIRQHLGAEFDIVRLERHFCDTSSPGTLPLPLALTGPPVRGIVTPAFAIYSQPRFFEFRLCVEEDPADVDEFRDREAEVGGFEGVEVWVPVEDADCAPAGTGGGVGVV
ncbi:hypothetical protein CNYM01_08931 [Colletotrichum nymphaeae SA-01]|uniref:Uncharacterized protein n=1 Tax=Colletotrichum nymphaeae SA-01 TaxID=1460502 RepID=A0A135TJE2_9PEZI|nr:hypothetical protein CNYM01_08931 [Colletotrichum nymphaeae SA-01]